MNRQIHHLTLILSLFVSLSGNAQYILNGSAQRNSCNCYTLTQAVSTQSGSVWNANKINLQNSFDFWFNVFLGCNDAGADGIVFILQPISTSVGSTGEGMGFGGVQPSIGIALDTYQNGNLNDPAYDHISIQANGNVNHSNDLAGPVPISATSNNVEDCQWHNLRISWDASTKWLRAYFDGVLRVEKQVDLVGTIFGNDPNVFWGFTGATGGSVNLQQFCTALNPAFITDLASGNIGCAPATVQFTSQSISFAPIDSYNWTFGNGNTSTAAAPPPQTFTTPGTYPVSLHIKGRDGCENDVTANITIGAAPDAMLTVYDTCFRNAPRFTHAASTFGIESKWRIDGGASSSNLPPLNNLAAGTHELQLIAASTYGCGLPDTATQHFVIKPLPEFSIGSTLNCLTAQFSGSQTDNQTTVNAWNWSFGDGQGSMMQNPLHPYAGQGQYNVKLWGDATNGCASDTARVLLKIPGAYAFAGNDTVLIKGQPFQLNGQGNGTYSWTGPGLSNPAIANPVIALPDESDYVLTVTTPEGCVAKDTIHIKVFKGPAIYVPGAFTPNGDGRNDVLRPVYVGIKKLERFAVFNRWGQQVYSTTDMRGGWDGGISQKIQPSGTYVWFIKATNEMGQPMLMKGTVVIIR